MFKMSTAHTSAFCWFIFFAWLYYVGQSFWSIGMATQDQIDFSLGALRGGILSESLHYAREQGRVYFVLTKPVELWLAAHPETFFAKAVTIASFALAPWFFAYAVFGAPAHRVLFIWIYFSLVYVDFQHLPPAAYPVVTSFPFAFWALAAWLVRAGDTPFLRKWRPSLVGLLSFAAFFQYEPITAMSVIGFTWIVYSAGLDSGTRNRLLLALTASIAVYATVYLMWSAAYQSGYGAKTIGDLSPWTVGRVFFAYTAGALPFGVTHAPPVIWGDGVVGKSLLSFAPTIEMLSLDSFPIGTILIYALAAVCVANIVGAQASVSKGRAYAAGYTDYFSTKHDPFRTVVAPIILFLALLVGANGLIAVSAKYQSWAEGMVAVYLTSQLALLPISALAVVVGKSLGGLFRPSIRKVVLGLTIGVTALAGIVIHEHNEIVAPRLRANLSRWEAVSLLAGCGLSSQQRHVVAPALFYSVFSSQANWGAYWASYAKYRFGRDITFFDKEPTGERAGIAKMYFSDEGYLKALLIHDPASVVVISRGVHPPGMLFSGKDKAWPLQWGNSRQCAGGGYRVIRFDQADLTKGANDQLVLVWSIPEIAAVPQQYYPELQVPVEQVRDAVSMLYRLYLGREADPGGLQYWSGIALDARGSLVRIVEEFESIKGETSPSEDAAVVTKLILEMGKTHEFDAGRLENQARVLPQFGRRCVLYRRMGR
jgi:hypothetical protein